MALFCFVCNGVRKEYFLDWENVFVGTDSFAKLRKCLAALPTYLSEPPRRKLR